MTICCIWRQTHSRYVNIGLLCFCRRAKILQHNDPGKNKSHKSLVPVQAAAAAEQRDCCVCVCVLQLQLCPPQHLRLFSPAKHASMLTGSNHFYHERVEMQMAPQCWYQSHPLDFPASAVVCTKQRDRQKQRVYSFPNSHRQCAWYSEAVKPRKRAPSAWFLPCVGQGRWEYWPAGLSVARSVAVLQNLQSSLFSASPLRHWSAESLHPSHIGRRTGTTRSASEFADEYNTSLKSRLSICFHSLIESCFLCQW